MSAIAKSVSLRNTLAIPAGFSPFHSGPAIMLHAAPLPVVRLPMYPKLKVYKSMSWTEK